MDDGDGDIDNDVHQLIIGTAGSIQWYFWDPPLYKGDNGDMTPMLLKHIHPKFGYILGEVDDMDVTFTFMGRNTHDLSVSGQYSIYDTWSYTAVPVMTLLEPNGGENFVSGSQLTVKWNTNEVRLIESVGIEYSDDNGETWNHIATVANSGSWLWETPEMADSNQCLVRVSPTDSIASGDESNDVFTLFQCQDIRISDLNKDCYVDMGDFKLFAADWLRCGNPFDPDCNGN